MKKEELIKLGVSEEVAEKVEESLRGYIPKARFDEVNNEKKRLEIELSQRDKQLSDLKSANLEIEELKKQIETLQIKNSEEETKHREEVKQLRIDSAVDTELLKAKAKNIKAVKALLKDLDKAELGEEGLVKGLSEQIEELKKTDGYLFETKIKLKGVSPGETGNDEGEKGVDTSKMTYSELAAYMADHPEVEI